MQEKIDDLMIARDAAIEKANADFARGMAELASHAVIPNNNIVLGDDAKPIRKKDK
jgi:hypothetical protein